MRIGPIQWCSQKIMLLIMSGRGGSRKGVGGVGEVGGGVHVSHVAIWQWIHPGPSYYMYIPCMSHLKLTINFPRRIYKGQKCRLISTSK